MAHVKVFKAMNGKFGWQTVNVEPAVEGTQFYDDQDKAYEAAVRETLIYTVVPWAKSQPDSVPIARRARRRIGPNKPA